MTYLINMVTSPTELPLTEIYLFIIQFYVNYVLCRLQGTYVCQNPRMVYNDINY